MSVASPHVVVISRWREHYAEYARYLDHTANRVTYVTTEVGLAAVPVTAAAVAVVPATDDITEVRARVRELAGRFGRPAAIVALKEDDLLVAATLRSEWQCRGWWPDQLVPFRDKYVMSGRVAAAGLPVPPFAAVSDQRDVVAFTERHGFPVVVKPRVGSSSDGVVRVGEAADIDLLTFDRPMLVQVCDPRRIYHVDGLFDGSRLLHWQASYYLNSCLGFRHGDVLGSVEEDDSATRTLIGGHTERFLVALSDTPTPFHLELFVDTVEGTCSFLEVGARVGGAEIPFLWRELHGYDLMAAAFSLQVAQPIPAGTPDLTEVGGWLLVPAPARRPCRITKAESMVGRRPGPYAEALVRPGDILPAADAYYEHVGGRFRFRGGTSSEVERAIRATSTAFRVAGAALDPALTG